MQNEVIHTAMHEIKVYLVNSFTRNNTGGNPAGVVLYPPALSVEQKIAIARQVGFSETAFVYQAKRPISRWIFLLLKAKLIFADTQH